MEGVTKSTNWKFDAMQDIFESQKIIRRRLFIGSSISYIWVRVQDHYLKLIDSEKLGKRYEMTLIQKL